LSQLLNLPPTEWPAWFKERGVPAFQGRNAARWVFQRGATDWQDMTDLPAGLRDDLALDAPLLSSTAETESGAKDGAVKTLIRYQDGASVEAVHMPGTAGHTICLSTQVGCPVKCQFCASGLDGLERNLTAGEILEQALWLRHRYGSFDRVVIMGMGDAGFNLEPTLQALDTLMAPEGMRMAARRLTLSTVAPAGCLPKFAKWGRQVKLALSLHATTDALRHELIPALAKRSIEETLKEADAVFRATGREYTVEYVLLAGVNDSLSQADELRRLLHGRRCFVNLIPYNPVSGLGFRRPDGSHCQAFADLLEKSGLPVKLRLSLGRSADAACGQLRRRKAKLG